MSFAALPPGAAWTHRDARTGFEVVYFRPHGDGLLITGTTTAVEADESWIVGYEIELAAGWLTRRAEITSRTTEGERRTLLECDGGSWTVDGAPAPHLDGCLDVDLESSALTNAFPMHRLGLDVGRQASAPAAYVRATSLTVERLDQTYARVPDGNHGQAYDYTAPVFDFRCRLTYDAAGLVLDYPGIAVRAD